MLFSYAYHVLCKCIFNTKRMTLIIHCFCIQIKVKLLFLDIPHLTLCWLIWNYIGVSSNYNLSFKTHYSIHRPVWRRVFLCTRCSHKLGTSFLKLMKKILLIHLCNSRTAFLYFQAVPKLYWKASSWCKMLQQDFSWQLAGEILLLQF